MDNLANFAYGIVATAPTPATTGVTIVLQTGDGASFPVAPFDVTLCPPGAAPTDSTAEIGRCTAISGDTLTVTRGQYGTTEQAVAVGWQVFQPIDANLLGQLLAKSDNLASVADAGSSRANIHVPALTPVAACSFNVGNVNIASAPASLDGVTGAVGDFWFLPVQITPSQNGVWQFNGAGVALTRPTEFPSGGVIKGRTVMVMGGSDYNVGSTWALVTPTAGITIDASSQMWVPSATPYGLPVLSVANPLFSPASVTGAVTVQGVSAIGLATVATPLSSFTVGELISHPAFPSFATYIGSITNGTSDSACSYNNSTALTTTGNFITDGVQPGMVVTDTGGGIPANTVVLSVNSATSITLSAATTGGSFSGRTVSFSGVITASSSPTSNVPIMASASSTSSVGVGQGGRQRLTDFCINNAIGALPASGGIVYIPSATYSISNTIKIGNGYNNAVQLNTASSAIGGASVWGGTRLDGTGGTGTVSYSSASNVITDNEVLATDIGAPVTGTNIPANSYVGTVTAGTSFLLSSSPTSQVNVNPTGSGTAVTVTPTFFATDTNPLTCNPNPQQSSFNAGGGSFGADLNGLPTSLCTYTRADSAGFHGVSFVNGTSSHGAPVNGTVAAASVNSTTAGVALVGASTSQYNTVSGPAGQGPILNWAGGNVVGPVIDILGPVNGWELRNLTISGNGSMTSNAGGGIGIRVTAASGGLAENVSVQQCPFAGFQTRAWPISSFGEGGNNVANTYRRLTINLMPNINGAYGIDINGLYPIYPTGGADADTFTDDFELFCIQSGPGAGNTNTMIHFGNADVNRVRVRQFNSSGLGVAGTTNFIMFDYTNDSGICASNLIDMCGLTYVGSGIVNNGTPSTVATYYPNRVVGMGTEAQGAPLSLANCLFGWQASQNATFASQTFTSGTGAQCTATSISVDNLAYITVTAGGTLTVAISEPWGNAGYTTLFNAVPVVAGPFPTIRVPAGCYLKLTAASGATYTTELQALI